MHFDNYTFSRDEDDYAILKLYLESSIDDISKIIKNFAQLYDSYRFNYKDLVEKNKQQLSTRLYKSLFQNIKTHITFFALTKILLQYNQLLDAQKKNIRLLACIYKFKTTIRLLCAYEIENILNDLSIDKLLQIKNIYYYW